MFYFVAYPNTLTRLRRRRSLVVVVARARRAARREKADSLGRRARRAARRRAAAAAAAAACGGAKGVARRARLVAILRVGIARALGRHAAAARVDLDQRERAEARQALRARILVVVLRPERNDAAVVLRVGAAVRAAVVRARHGVGLAVVVLLAVAVKVEAALAVFVGAARRGRGRGRRRRAARAVAVVFVGGLVVARLLLGGRRLRLLVRVAVVLAARVLALVHPAVRDRVVVVVVHRRNEVAGAARALGDVVERVKRLAVAGGGRRAHCAVVGVRRAVVDLVRVVVDAVQRRERAGLGRRRAELEAARVVEAGRDRERALARRRKRRHFGERHHRLAERALVRRVGRRRRAGGRRRLVVQRDAAHVRDALAVGRNCRLDVRRVAAKDKPRAAAVGRLAGPHRALLDVAHAVGRAAARPLLEVKLLAAAPQRRAPRTLVAQHAHCRQPARVVRKLNAQARARRVAALGRQTAVLARHRKQVHCLVLELVRRRQPAREHGRVRRRQHHVSVLRHRQRERLARQVFVAFGKVASELCGYCCACFCF